ncbi:MAG: DUF2079 domain-containing protein [Pseudoclavibacter sp.]
MSASSRRIRVWWPAIGVAFGCLGIYTALSVQQWVERVVPSWDLAIFTEAVRGWAIHGWPVIDIKGAGAVQLGDHFSPVLMLLAPLWRLFPSPLMLLIVQDVLIAISIVPIVQCASRRLGRLAGVLIGVAYGLSWGIQSGIASQFHEYAFAVPLLAFGLSAFLEHRWRQSAVWMLLLLTVKEDLGFTAVVFGALLFFAGQRRLGAVVSSVSLAWTALVLLVVIPAFRAGHRWGYWGALDWSALGHGWQMKLATLLLLGSATMFVAFLSPLILLIVPTLAWRFLSADSYYWGPWWHYSLILMPIIFLAAVDILARWRTSQRDVLEITSRVVPVALAVLPLALMMVPSPAQTRVPSELRTIASPSSWRPSAHEREIRQVLSKIPAGSRVASDVGLISYVAARDDVYWVGDPVPGGPQFVLLTPWKGGPDDVARYAEDVYHRRYRTVYDRSGYKLAQMIAAD